MLPYITVFGVELPMYGLCMSFAISIALLLSWLRAKKRGLEADSLVTIALFAITLGIVGSKLLFLFVTYSPAQIIEGFRANGLSFFAESGLVFYGGLIGGVAGAFLGAAIFKKDLVAYCDSIVPTLPLAHAIGRMGCFCSGCCYGAETDAWYGMCFPYSVNGLDPLVKVIPTQLIESGANLIVFAFLMIFTLKKRRGCTTLFVYLMIYAVERFLIEFLRGDEIRGIYFGLSTSQWISIALFAAGLTGLLLTRAHAKKQAV